MRMTSKMGYAVCQPWTQLPTSTVVGRSSGRVRTLIDRSHYAVGQRPERTSGWESFASQGQYRVAGTGLTVAMKNGGLSFDGLGRVTSSSQTTNGSTWTFPQYQYNLADELTSMKLPSGRVVATAYDSAGRPASLQGTLDATKVYASSFSYAPHGAATGMMLGNGLWASTAFNSRLQTTAMNLGITSGSSNIWGLTNSFSSSGKALIAKRKIDLRFS